MPRGKEVDVGILVYAREAKLEILNRSMTHEIAFEMAASNVRFGAGDSFVSATARAFAKFAALVTAADPPATGSPPPVRSPIAPQQPWARHSLPRILNQKFL